MSTKTMTMDPTTLLDYQDELVRTGQFLPLGRMSRVAVGPNADWKPVTNDPIIDKYGRMIDLRGQFLSIGQSLDRTMVLVTAPLINREGRVALPDLPDPTWKPDSWSEEEVKDSTKRDPKKDQARMVEQRLRDRADAKLVGSNIIQFTPVLRITYQVELDKKFQPVEWRISFRPDSSGRHCAFLVDERTGVAHFFGGVPVYDGDSRG
jgi:hypothetical protein